MCQRERNSVDDHVLTVEKQRLLLDGKELAKLSASVSKVQVRVAQGRLTVLADGAEVLSKSLGSK